MKAVYIENISVHEGSEVTLRGWVYNRRSSGKLQFILLRDGTGIMQCVAFRGNIPPEQFEELDKLTQESSLEVTGKVRLDERAPGGFELEISGFRIYQIAESYPITPKEHGTAFLMENRHLWLRSSRQHAAIRIRHEIIKATRDYFDDQGFTLVDTPIFTPNACEGTTTLFETEYFDDKAYLTQSGQLYNEATAAAFGKVYCFGPTFRAENSNTSRHAAEIWMIEPEMAFCDLAGDMDLSEEFIKATARHALEDCAEDLGLFEKFVDKTLRERLAFVLERPFQRVSYTDAVEILAKSGRPFEHPVQYGLNFQSEHERFLTEEHFKCPVTVFNYPREIKPFYMRLNDDGKTVAAMDVLVPGIGEVIGGSQREERLEVLEANMRLQGLQPEAYWWYLDLRRYGTVPHAGFGLGFERLLMFLTGVSNIRDVIPFARTPGNVEF